MGMQNRTIRVLVPAAVLMALLGVIAWLAIVALGGASGNDESFDVLPHASAYVKYDGIDGEAQDQAHAGWTDVASWSYGAERPGSGDQSGQREHDLSGLVVTTRVDKATPLLMGSLVSGHVFPKVEIHLTGPSATSTCKGEYFAIELKNAIVSGYSMRGSSEEPVTFPRPGSVGPGTLDPLPGTLVRPQTFSPLVDAPLVDAALNFEEIRITYKECNKKGKPTGVVTEFHHVIELPPP